MSRAVRKRIVRLTPSLLSGGVLFLAIVALVLLATPRVTSIVPEDGSVDVSSKQSLQLLFTHEMNTETVESRISIDPDVVGNFIWEDRTLVFQPDDNWPEGTTINIFLESGASAKILLPMLRSYTTTFQIADRRVIYLWPDSDPADLYLRQLDDEETERLTQTESGILDYCLSPDGDHVIYSLRLPDGGNELRQFSISTKQDRQIFACPHEDHCQAISFSPSGNKIAFERFGFVSGQGGQPFPGPSNVWLLNLESEAEATSIGDMDHVTSSPNWSATGLLAYYDDTLKAIALVDIESDLQAEPFNYIPNDLDLSGSWSPDGQYLIYASIVIQENDSGDASKINFYSHIYRMDVNTGNVFDLTGDDAGRVEDAAPRYSPDGEWIAFTRKHLEEARWTLGRQLWVMRSDGSDPRQLTADPNLHVSSIFWSPDAQMLTFVRKNVADLTQAIEIWVIGVDGEGEALLIEGGYAPQWVP